jgi:hypothetical protein
MGHTKEKITKNSIVLAHHPSCKNFSHHTFNFHGRRLCMGCFIMYPSAAASLAVLLILNNYFHLDYFALLISSLVLFGVNAIRKLLLKDNIKKWAHVFFRIMLGFTLALAIMSIIRAPEDRQIQVAVFVLAVAVIYNFYNGMRNMNICKKCGQYSSFPHCEGALEPDSQAINTGENINYK